ncbi:protein ImuB [Sphingomonas laterariae]|uniref:Protein ImuB n=1 Tax=Edaphosphingomonas laterariae TaxID=861865 RepID=A0A239E9N1_9SPHN|nr:protein ImuB [Sphingomonas laterariae]
MKGALRLAAVDPVAMRLGLAPGLALADARARVPDLAVADHDPAADATLLDALAAGCGRYTPLVAIDAPDGLLLDITGCAHLFGGDTGLAADAEARLIRAGLTLRHALAGTADGAHALARFQTAPAPDEAAAIKRLPVAALRLDPEAETGLKRAGLKTVGDLACRPLAGIAARFGADAVTALRRLLGEAESPIIPRRTEAMIRVERRFAEPIASTDYALAVLTELATEARARLEERKAGGRRFEALFFRSDGLARAIMVETGQPTRDPAVVMRLLRERIETLRDPIDPGFGFDMVRLAVPVAEPLAATQLKLEGGAIHEAEIAALVDRLSTRLGRGRVRRFRARDTHIPEQAQLALPAIATATPAAWVPPAPDEPPLRPIHLFDPPQRIEVIAEVPDGPPHRFRWRREAHEVRRYEGPERIGAEWWRRKDGAVDQPGLTRDYYRVEDVRGRRFWIFRHGLYSEKPDPGWYLHGIFA